MSIKHSFTLLISFCLIVLCSCETKTKSNNANDIIPFFQHWNLILGDGSNAGKAIDYNKRILSKHSLLASIKMPVDIFFYK